MEEMIAAMHEMMKKAAETGWVRGADLQALLEDMELKPEMIRAVFRYLEKQEIRVIPRGETKEMDPGEDQTLALDRLGDDEQKLLQMIYGGGHTLEDIARWMQVSTDFARKIVLDVGRCIGDVRYLPCRKDLLPDLEDGSTIREKKAEPEREDKIIWQHRRDLLIQVLPQMLEKEAQVMRMRLGMDGRVYTREETAAHFGVTPQRIRQIENKTIRKALRLGRDKNLQDFYT